MHHVALRTADVTSLAAFYRRVFGLEELRSGDTSVWLKAGTTILMVEQREAHEPRVPPGSQEMFALGITPSERTSLVLRLSQERVPVEAETDFTVYFRDPDGRKVGASHYPLPRA